MDITHVSETEYPVASSNATPVSADPSPDVGMTDATNQQEATPSADNTANANPDQTTNPTDSPATTDPLMTKSQLKKQKRRAAWEDRKEDRKRIRKEKRHEQQARKRSEKAARIAEAEAAGLDPREVLLAEQRAMAAARPKPQLTPVAFIVDCDFEDKMTEKEFVSLSSQVTRCYSDNRQSSVQAHLVICPWGGKMRERYETVLGNAHKGWKGVRFAECDFVQAGKEVLEHMKGSNGGVLVDTLKPQEATEEGTTAPPAIRPNEGLEPTPEAEPGSAEASIVYLTSDSPYILDKLEPHTTYVIGGIVDRNREKGLCYRRARERGVRTAKLPISDYMVMASRQVLTTNQVVEIMLKWLVCGDWKVAFQQVMPKRKGGVIKSEKANGDDVEDEGEGEEEDTNAEPASNQVPEVAQEKSPDEHIVA